MSLNIRKRQRESITRMLALNERGSAEESKPAELSATWKSLIYDSYCLEILTPLFQLGDLRKLGITDNPAVYFVRPTAENIDQIAKDAARNLYDSMYLNFASSLPRPLLESLARKCLETDSVGKLTKLFDQHCEFVCLEARLISLNQRHSFVKLNDHRNDESLMAYIDSLVDSLFSIVATMGVVPIIRARPGEAAEMVAQKLNTRLRDHLMSRNNLFNTNTTTPAMSRPVLLIMDRSFDLVSPLHHPGTYQALLQDLIGIEMNRIEVLVPEEESKGDSKSAPKGELVVDASGKRMRKISYNLDSKEKFWRGLAGNPFPQVASAVEALVKEWTAERDEVVRKSKAKSSTGLDSEELDSMMSAISSLTDVDAKKKLVDQHTNMASAALKAMQERVINEYWAMEQDIQSKATVELKQLVAMLGPSGKGKATDKIRLFLQYFLCNDNASDAEMKELGDAVAASLKEESKGSKTAVDLAALNYLKTFKFTSQLSADKSGGGGSKPKAPTSRPAALFGRIADLVYSQVIAASSDLLPLTKIVDAVMANKDTAETEKYLTLDPKASKTRLPPSQSELKSRGAGGAGAAVPFKDGVVFMIGSGNYAEYQGLQDWAKKNSTQQSRRTVSYACTELASPDNFAAQLSLLGGGGIPPGTAGAGAKGDAVGVD